MIEKNKKLTRALAKLTESESKLKKLMKIFKTL
jgi:hypothetical protein